MTYTPAPTDHVVRNAARRPVELHIGEATMILQPGDVINIAADDPYCAALLRRGVLTRHSLPEPAPVTATRSGRGAPKRARKAAPKQAATEHVATKQVATKQAAAKKAAPRRGAPKKAASKKATST